MTTKNIPKVASLSISCPSFVNISQYILSYVSYSDMLKSIKNVNSTFEKASKKMIEECEFMLKIADKPYGVKYFEERKRQDPIKSQIYDMAINIEEEYAKEEKRVTFVAAICEENSYEIQYSVIVRVPVRTMKGFYERIRIEVAKN